MKKLKIVLLFLTMAALLVCLTGCGNKIVGKWVLTDGEAYDQLMGLGNIEFEFKKNGEMVMTITALGMSETENGTWETKGDTLTITSEGEEGEACEYAIKGDKLTIIGADEIDMIFSRKD